MSRWKQVVVFVNVNLDVLQCQADEDDSSYLDS